MATKAKEPKTIPAEDAAAEVENRDVKVTFRGEEFIIPRAAFSSPAFALSLSSGKYNDITYSLLAAVSPDAARRFIAVCTPEDTMVSVGVEFIEAVSAVAGQGNSSAS